jgi:PAS domain S-box-containing protein
MLGGDAGRTAALLGLGPPPREQRELLSHGHGGESSRRREAYKPDTRTTAAVAPMPGGASTHDGRGADAASRHCRPNAAARSLTPTSPRYAAVSSRSRWRISPLRLRLLALVALASIPIGLLVARLTTDERHAIYLRERDTAFRLLDVSMAEHRDQMRTGRELLRLLAGIPEVATGDPATCGRALRRFLSTYSGFSGAARITTDLRMDCSSSTDPDSVSDVSTLPAVIRASQIGGSADGFIQMGRLGQPLASIIEPVRDATGKTRFYLSVDAQLHWFRRLGSALPGDTGVMAAVVDATGFIYARQPDHERFAGMRYEPNTTLRAMIGQESGFVDGVGLDQLERLYAFRELAADNGDQVLLMIGIPTAVAYAYANRHLQANVFLAGLMVLLGLAMAWLAADLFVIRDVKALLSATERLADGDLSTRAPRLTSGGELGALAERFNDMARRLEQRRREFVVLGDSSPDAIARVNSELRVEWANAALLQRLRLSLDDLAGRTLAEVPLEPGVVAAVEHHARLVFESGRRIEAEEFVQAPTGDVWLDLRIAPERNAAGDLTHVMVVARDVTARRQLAAHLAQAERLDSIGKLAGHIAHDFNNLLTAIIGNAEIALRAVEPTDRVTGDLAKILDVSRRASLLTKQLLSFARRQTTQPRVIDVNAFLEEATPLLRRVIGEQVTLALQFEPSAPRIRFDPTQLEQVLVNLAANARDAMPAGGMLTIGTALDLVTPGDGEPTDERPPGEYLQLTVTDTGAGMSSDVLERIFEPFFSTKHGQGGTGLGLAVAYGAVRQHGGTIEVDSAEHTGTSFRIYIPATQARPDRVEVQPWTPEAPRGQETLLLVEDQEEVRNTIARLLRAHGYGVFEAADGVEALSMLSRGEPRDFQLLITDLVMPNMGGEALVTALRGSHPRVPVLVISGFDQQGSVRRMFERGDAAAFLEKPFEAQPMLRLVRELLDATSARSYRRAAATPT